MVERYAIVIVSPKSVNIIPVCENGIYLRRIMVLFIAIWSKSHVDPRQRSLTVRCVPSKTGISLLVCSQAELAVDVISGMEDTGVNAYHLIQGFMVLVFGP